MQYQRFSSEKLKQIRRAAGVSRTSLAWACGVSSSTVAEWEQGKYAPRVGTLEAVARTLNVSVAELFGEATDA